MIVFTNLDGAKLQVYSVLDGSSRVHQSGSDDRKCRVTAIIIYHNDLGKRLGGKALDALKHAQQQKLGRARTRNTRNGIVV